MKFQFKLSHIIISLYVLFVLGFIYVFLYHRPAMEAFLQQYGLSALFTIVFFSDLNFFLTPDIFLAPAVLIGMHAWLVAIVAGIASTLSGLCYYYLCYFANKDYFQKTRDNKHVKTGKKLLDKYGWGAIFIGGFTPIPFNIVSALAGFYKMNIITYSVMAFFSRTLRFLLVALFGVALGIFI